MSVPREETYLFNIQTPIDKLNTSIKDTDYRLIKVIIKRLILIFIINYYSKMSLRKKDIKEQEWFKILNHVCVFYHTAFGISSFDDDFNDMDMYTIDKLTLLFKKDDIKGCELLPLLDIKIPIEKIIIKYIKDTWYSKPSHWWNDYSKWWFSKVTEDSLWKEEDRLPLFKDYVNVDRIKIISPSMKVEVTTPTIGDILYATRILALDDTRVYDGFRIVSYRKGVLTLEPEMDNFST